MESSSFLSAHTFKVIARLAMTWSSEGDCSDELRSAWGADFTRWPTAKMQASIGSRDWILNSILKVDGWRMLIMDESFMLLMGNSLLALC